MQTPISYRDEHPMKSLAERSEVHKPTSPTLFSTTGLHASGTTFTWLKPTKRRIAISASHAIAKLTASCWQRQIRAGAQQRRGNPQRWVHACMHEERHRGDMTQTLELTTYDQCNFFACRPSSMARVTSATSGPWDHGREISTSAERKQARQPPNSEQAMVPEEIKLQG